MSGMSAVAGHGVPVGAFHAQGMQAVGNGDPLQQGVPAVWANLVPVSPPPHDACQATTKKGNKCPSARVVDEATGDLTPLCVGHWKQVLAAFPPEPPGEDTL